MAQSFVALKTSSGALGAYRVTGTTATPIGATFGSAETAADTQVRAINRILVANNGLSGVNKVQMVGWMKQDIYTFNEANGWSASRYTLAHTLYNGTSTQNGHSGLYLIMISGVPTIVGFYLDNTDTWNMVHTTDQTWKNWTEVALISLGDGFPHTPFSELMFKNTFYTCNPNQTGHLSYDINGGVPTVRVESDIPANPQDFCGFANAVYKIAESVSTPGYWIWALNAGIWTRVYQLPTPSNPGVVNANTVSLNAHVRPLLFDGGNGKAYAIYQSIHDATHWGIQCVELTISGLSISGVDISSTVLPPSFAYGVQATSGIGWQCVIETKTIPGNSSPVAATPVIHLYAMVAMSGPWSYFPWNGPGTLIGNGGLAAGTGLDYSYCLPQAKEGGNDRIWYPGDFWVDAKAIAGFGTNINIDLVAYGPLGTEIKSALAYFSVAGQQTVYVCKLIGCSKVSGAGATPALAGDGHSATNLTCDGATLYRLVWDASNEVAPGPILNNEDVEVTVRIF